MSVRISIVTPTYNRRANLTRLFQSLVNQKYQDIEWVVINDGGTDDTPEAIKQFQACASFTIKYVLRENGGKNLAANTGLEIASGDLVSVIDDDDYFLPEVFEGIARDFDEACVKGGAIGLSYLSVDETGAIRGRTFPQDRMLSDLIDCRINLDITGDKCEFTVLRIFKDHCVRFPSMKVAGGDTNFLRDISAYGKTCFINVPVLAKNYLEGGTTANWRSLCLANPEATALYYQVYLDRRVRWRIRMRYLVAYVALLRYMKKPLLDEFTTAAWNRPLLPFVILPGILISVGWKRSRPVTRKPPAATVEASR